jgi:hypothetical protein
MQLLFAPSIEDDKCAFLEKAARRACSDSRASTRHNDNFVFESSHDFSDEPYGRSSGKERLIQATRTILRLS